MQAISVSSMKAGVLNLLKLLPPAVHQRILRNQAVKLGYHSLRKRYRYLRALIHPYKSARVYVRKGIGRMEFFSILNQRKIEYVMLRWWEELPEMPPDEDMDILIKDEDREKIKDLVTFADNGTGLKCDIYTLTGDHHGSHKGIPYFQSNLGRDLLKNRKLYRDVYVPGPREYFASLAYHAIFHKGGTSGLKGFEEHDSPPEHEYPDILKQQLQKLDLDVEISVKGLFNWLEEQDYVPAEDTLAKLVEIKPELSFLQKPLVSDIRGGELMVYVIREQLIEDDLLEDFKHFLQKDFLFDILDVHFLDSREKERCTRYIRGGKWDKGPYRFSGGIPAAFLVAYDYHPEPLAEADQKKQSRTTNNNNLQAKYTFRNLINARKNSKEYNGVHSADNETDARYYLSLLGEEYKRNIEEMAELRRSSFARKWNLVSLLSKSKISKVELIDFGGQLAVMKTFRPGAERFFKRELFALKELSKELDFIPNLLEEGENFLVMQYVPDILKGMSREERNTRISTCKKDIIGMIDSFYKRGLALINFGPRKLLLTANGKLYCTGFSYLHKYEEVPPNIDEAYEVEGVPGNFKGDVPEGFDPSAACFKNIWRPILGEFSKEFVKAKKQSSQLI